MEEIKGVIPRDIGLSEKAKTAAEACIDRLKERYQVRKVYLCGSLAGGGPFHARSDIDLVVEGLAPKDYIEALCELWSLLPEGLELDLIRIENAPLGLIRRIRGEDKMPSDPKEAIKIEIQNELQNLERLAKEVKRYLAKAPTDPGYLEISGIGKLIHDFYNGIEQIFERVAVRIDDDLPQGSHWHTDLLHRMEMAWGEKRPAVINHSLALELQKYLRFRHLFRHSYGYELLWEEIQPLAKRLSGILKEIRQQLQQFLAKL